MGVAISLSRIPPPGDARHGPGPTRVLASVADVVTKARQSFQTISAL
jgi:hypothetical protein